MDTKTLVVGQKVRLQSGNLFKEARVIGISDYRVETELAPDGNGGLVSDGRRLAIHFTRNGKPGTIFEKVRQCGLFLYLGDTGGWIEEDRRPMCTEFGPWELVG